jgi:O-antigen/teichoic acid export membrane protein
VSLSKVIRGSLWLYVSGVASNLLYYTYWLIASKFVSSSTIGTAAAALGIAILIAGIFNLGLALGATKLFGYVYGHNDQKSLNLYFSSTFALSLSIYSLVAILVLFLPPSIIGLSGNELLFVALLIISGYSSWSHIVVSLFSSTIKTGTIALSNILSALLRLVIGTIFLMVGMDLTGVMAAYIVESVASDLIYFYKLRGVIKFMKPSLEPIKEVIKAGIPSWIPSLLTTAGTWLGVLGIYGLAGSNQTGNYYIAFMIASVLYSLPSSFLSLMLFPVLSGMDDGRKRATNKSVRLTCAVIAPLSVLVIAYPQIPLSILNASYVASSSILQILFIGTFIAPIAIGFESLVYAYSKYQYVAFLGISANLSRVALYPVLVTLWGGNGAAISYISGYFLEIMVVALLSRRLNYIVGWKPFSMIVGIPSLVGLLFYYINLNWVVSTILLFTICSVAYSRLGLITKEDLSEISAAFVSRGNIEVMSPYIQFILKILYGE